MQDALRRMLGAAVCAGVIAASACGGGGDGAGAGPTGPTGPSGPSGPVSHPLTTIAFGAHVLVVDSGSSATLPALSGADASGNPVSNPVAAYAVRSNAVASVSSSGIVSGVARGETMVVATASSASSTITDSCLIVVAAAGGPVLMTDLPRFDFPADTVLSVAIIADTRASPTGIGSLAAKLTWNPAVLTYSASSSTVAAISDANASTGTLTFAMASAQGAIGRTTLVLVMFHATAGSHSVGTLALTGSEITSTDFNSLLSKTTFVSMPTATR